MAIGIIALPICVSLSLYRLIKNVIIIVKYRNA
jgi:hypothetical protein